MSIKRLFKKNFFGGGMIHGHIMDAIQKKRKQVNLLESALKNQSRKHLLKIYPEQVISIIWEEKMAEFKEL